MYKYLCLIMLLAGLLIGVGVQADQNQADFAGHWYVIMNAPAGELPYQLILHKQGDSYAGEVTDGHYHTTLQNFKLDDGQLTFGIDDARIRFAVRHSGDKELTGLWTRTGKSSVASLPFIATREPRKFSATRPLNDFLGEWQCSAKEDDGKETPVLLIVKANGDRIEGTGIDPTGDFGVMQGYQNGDQLVLGRFDGQSLSLVVAKRQGENLQAAVSTSPAGQFSIAGARRGATLPDPGSVAKVNASLNFNFPDVEGHAINFPGDQFKGKVVIIDIMGTWCHNCHDETPFLVELYNKYHDKGLEIVALCFEAQASSEEDIRSIANYRQSRKIPYHLLYAGRVDGNGPAKSIAGLENFGGYPTNIFINRSGQIAATHTGFWGPATGEKYTVLKHEFEATVKKLLE